MTTNHTDYQFWLSLQLDGELDPQRQERLARHVETCDDCAALQRELRGMRAGMKADETALPVGLAGRILARVERDAAAPAEPVEPSRLRPVVELRFLRISAAAAAVVLFVLSMATIAQQPDEASAAPPTAEQDALRERFREIERKLPARDSDHPLVDVFTGSGRGK